MPPRKKPEIAYRRRESGARRLLDEATLAKLRPQRKILVIEDHYETRLLLSEHFARAGYCVEGAENGNDGISAALRMKPDVILLDLAMPRLDGWETVSVLRSYPSTARIPVIACTAVDDEAALALAMDLGCIAVVRKPCVPRDIQEVVNDVLDAAESKAATGEAG